MAKGMKGDGFGTRTGNIPGGAGGAGIPSRMTQKFGTLRFVPIGLSEEVRAASVESLNQILADTITLRELYKKHHWQVAGPTFYQLHLLFDKHYEEQAPLVDSIAERIQLLGGVAISLPRDVAAMQSITDAPADAEDVPTQLARFAEAHMRMLMHCHAAAKKADEMGDDGTNDLLVSELIRTNEMHAWFINEHRISMPLTHDTALQNAPETSRTEGAGAPMMHS
jgi:starvation-inducible DNA-binding protein